MKLLVDKLNHAHWLRIKYNVWSHTRSFKHGHDFFWEQCKVFQNFSISWVEKFTHFNTVIISGKVIRDILWSLRIKNLTIKNIMIFQGFFPGGTGGVSPSGENFANSPPSDTCPHFWTKACPPQPRYVSENLKNLNTFLCQNWLLLRGYCTPG